MHHPCTIRPSCQAGCCLAACLAACLSFCLPGCLTVSKDGAVVRRPALSCASSRAPDSSSSTAAVPSSLSQVFLAAVWGAGGFLSAGAALASRQFWQSQVSEFQNEGLKSQNSGSSHLDMPLKVQSPERMGLFLQVYTLNIDNKICLPGRTIPPCGLQVESRAGMSIGRTAARPVSALRSNMFGF